jgi:hypothetical protein
MRTTLAPDPRSAGSPTPPTKTPDATIGRRSGWRSASALIGLAYTVTWIVGLAVWPTNLGIGSTDALVASDYRASAGQAITQYLLVEGLAGLLLAAVVASVVRPALSGRLRGGMRLGVLAALSAAAVSVAQTVIGMVVVADAHSHRVAGAGSAFDLVNRLDGVKMLLLALAAAAIVARARTSQRAPTSLRLLGYALAAALTISGISYLSLAANLDWTVYLSGPLLIVWVPSLGHWLGTKPIGNRL